MTFENLYICLTRLATTAKHKLEKSIQADYAKAIMIIGVGIRAIANYLPNLKVLWKRSFKKSLFMILAVTVVIAGSPSILPKYIYAAGPPVKVDVNCTPNPVTVHSGSNCTANVTNGDNINTLNGIQITFSSGGSGSFSPATTCNLSGDATSASCFVAYTPSVVGTVPYKHKITATFEGGNGYNQKFDFTDLTVDKINLTVSGLSASSKTYDGTTATTITGTGSLNEIIVGDVSLAGSAVGTFGDANVGTPKSVSVSGLSLVGTDAGNYTLAQPTGLTAGITKKDITGSFTADNKVYDGTNTATVLTPRPLSGVVTGDYGRVSLTGGLATFANANVGTSKTVTASGMVLSGLLAGNYNLTSVSTTTADITARPLTVTANDKSKVYGDSDPTLTYRLTSGSLVNSDVFSGSLVRNIGEKVGVYTINQGALSAGNNYAITYISTGFNITIGSSNTIVILSTTINGDGSISATIPTATTNSATSGVMIDIPAGTVVTAPAGSGWDGTLQLPQIIPATGRLPIGYILGNEAIKIGSPNFELSLNQAVIITLSGATGPVGYKAPRADTWVVINSVCGGNYASPSLPSGANECSISDGASTKIVTNHFTQFAVFIKSNVYVVRAGDTMIDIAYKFKLTLAQLEKWNPQAGHPPGNYDLILPGDSLNIGGAILTTSAITLGENTGGGLIGTALSTTNPNAGQAKGAAVAVASAAKKATSPKWYWYAAIAAVVLAAGGISYTYQAKGKKNK